MNPSDKTEHRAALWVVRLERGLTAAEQDEFLEWLGADPRHGEALNQQSSSWQRLNLLADWRPMHGARPNCDLLAPPPRRALLQRQAIRFVFSGLAVAAALVAGFFLISPREANPPKRSPMAVEPIATIEPQTLSDGTVVELNRGAQLSVDFTDRERRVELTRGEAHFEVAKGQVRPFLVSAGGATVRAVGTAFHVHLQPTAVRVLVTEGQVEVQPPAGAPAQLDGGSVTARVDAGQRCVVSLSKPAPPEVAPVTGDELAAALAWQPRMLDFTDAQLSDIVAEYNRCNAPLRIVVSDRELAETPLSASLRSDNIEGFLRLLKGGFGIESERAGNVVTLRRGRRP